MKSSDSKSKSRRYRSTLRAEQAKLTRSRIVDAAIQLAGVSNKTPSYTEIAAEADVSTPTVYRHFPTRDDLFAAVFERIDPDARARAARAEAALRHVIVFVCCFDVECMR